MLPSRRSHILAVAFLAAAFFIGGAAGWCLKVWAGAREHNNRDPQAMVAYLAQQLGLSAEQQDSVEKVLEHRRVEMDSIWQAARPRIDSLRRTMQLEIEEELTPAQQERFRELVAWHDRQRRAADSASEDLWDPDRDGVPEVVDECKNTPPGTLVESTGCTANPGRDGPR